MNSNLIPSLAEKYPKIIRPDIEICVGDGWYNILDTLCSNIQQTITRSRKTDARNIRYNRALRRAINGDIKGLAHFYCQPEDSNMPWFVSRIKEDIRNKHFREIKKSCPQVVAAQIKEKFGGLRFYASGGNDITDALIIMAEDLSLITCEECGSPGKVRSTGWITVRCEECQSKYEDKNT